MSNPCPKPRAVLAKDQAIDIFRLSISNDTQKIKPTAISVAKKYRVSEKTVRDIWTGRTWQEETLVFDLTRSPREAKKTGRPLGRKDSGPRKMKATIGNIRKNPQITKSASVKVLHSEYKEFTRDGEVGAFQIDEQDDTAKVLKFDPTISTVHRPDGWLREGRASSIELDQSPVPTTELDEMQRHLIDRCDVRAAALYLFLVTVADAQGLSYYGGVTLMQRLHLSAEDLSAARRQLLELDLVAYEAPLYQVLAIAGTIPAPAPASASPRAAALAPGAAGNTGAPVSLATLLGQLEQRRGRL